MGAVQAGFPDTATSTSTVPVETTRKAKRKS